VWNWVSRWERISGDVWSIWGVSINKKFKEDKSMSNRGDKYTIKNVNSINHYEQALLAIVKAKGVSGLTKDQLKHYTALVQAKGEML
jgi:hypothetical protein